MPQTPGKFIPSIFMMYFAMVAGIVIFALMVIVLTNHEIKQLSFNDPILWFVAIISLAFYWISKKIYESLLGKISKSDLLPEKMRKSVLAHVVRYMPLEISALAGVVCFLAFSNWAFLLVTAFILLNIYLIIPKKEIILNDLKLTNEERKLFEENQ